MKHKSVCEQTDKAAPQLNACTSQHLSTCFHVIFASDQGLFDRMPVRSSSSRKCNALKPVFGIKSSCRKLVLVVGPESQQLLITLTQLYCLGIQRGRVGARSILHEDRSANFPVATHVFSRPAVFRLYLAIATSIHILSNVEILTSAATVCDPRWQPGCRSA